MAKTDFGNQKPTQARAWVLDTIMVYRDECFWVDFMGNGDNSILQVANEMKKVRGADRALFTLIPDLTSTGVVGGGTLRGNEEAMTSQTCEVQIDYIRNAVINSGKMDDQRSVIDFREHAKDSLGNWRAQTMDGLIFNTLSGIGYANETDGSARVVAAGQTPLTGLTFAADVTAPTANRHFNATATGLTIGSTASISSANVFTYKTVLAANAEAQVKGLKPLKNGGSTYYVLVVHPYQMMQLKADADFNRNLITAGERGDKNPVFNGAVVTMDGMIIHKHNRVVNTKRAASGSKWGTSGLVDGARALLLGRQALLVADLLGDTSWEEQDEDYKDRNGISIGMMIGMKKPVFIAKSTGTSEDFGVICINSSI